MGALTKIVFSSDDQRLVDLRAMVENCTKMTAIFDNNSPLVIFELQNAFAEVVNTLEKVVFVNICNSGKMVFIIAKRYSMRHGRRSDERREGKPSPFCL